jgi:hypothetical protein
MRRVLFLNVDGISEERTTNIHVFNIDDFEDFDAFNMYDSYFVLYNTLETVKNKTRLPFTSDVYNGNILIIKRKEDKIVPLTVDKFVKLIDKKMNVLGEEYSLSNSDSDPFDEMCDKSGEC